VSENPWKRRPGTPPLSDAEREALENVFGEKPPLGDVEPNDPWTVRVRKLAHEKPMVRACKLVSFAIADGIENTMERIVDEGLEDDDNGSIIVANAFALALSSFLSLRCPNKAKARQAMETLTEQVMELYVSADDQRCGRGGGVDL